MLQHLPGGLGDEPPRLPRDMQPAARTLQQFHGFRHFRKSKELRPKLHRIELHDDRRMAIVFLPAKLI